MVLGLWKYESLGNECCVTILKLPKNIKSISTFKIYDNIFWHYRLNSLIWVNTMPFDQTFCQIFDYFPYFLFSKELIFQFSGAYLAVKWINKWLIGDL